MPRKHPLPPPEAALGKRLREFREKRLISQTQFAAELRISRAQLINYEGGISPLPWPVAKLLVRTFEVNPRWLATGEEPIHIANDYRLPDPPLEMRWIRTPFSEVYSSFWKHEVEAETMRQIAYAFDPSQKVDDTWLKILENASMGWLQRIPPGKEREFFLALCTEGERLVLRFNSPKKTSTDRDG